MSTKWPESERVSFQMAIFLHFLSMPFVYFYCNVTYNDIK